MTELVSVIPNNVKNLVLLSLAATKSNAKSSSAHARPLTKGASQVAALLVSSTTMTSKDKKSTFTICKYIICLNDEASFREAIANGLDPQFHRWNPRTNAVEVACQRYMNADDARAASKNQRNKYPENENDWMWIPFPSLSVVSIVDSKTTVSAADVASLVKIVGLVPRMKAVSDAPAPQAMDVEGAAGHTEKPRLDKAYGWRAECVSIVQPKGLNRVQSRIPPHVLPSVMWQLPERMFHVEDPRITADQESILLRVVPQWDVERFVGSKCRDGRTPITYTTMVPRTEIDVLDVFAYELKDNAGEPPRFWLCRGGGDTKKRSEKYYSSATTIIQFDGHKAQRITSQMTLWDREVESMFAIRDLDIWVNVFRFSLPLFRWVVIAGVMADKTAKGLLNITTAATAGQDHGLDMDSFDPNSLLPSAKPATTAGDDNKPAASDANHEEDLQAEAAKEQDALETAGDDGVGSNFDFALALNCNGVSFDAFNEFRRVLIPVSVEWVMQGVEVLDPLTGQKVLDNKTGKPKLAAKPFGRVLPNMANYPPNTIIQREEYKIQGKFSEPDKFPLITCVSDLLPAGGVLTEFNKFIQAGRGEYRVAVNQPMFSNPENAAAIMKQVETLTQQEGGELLDTGAVKGKPMPWAPISGQRYALFYLHHNPEVSDENRANVLRSEWAGRIVEHMIPATRPAAVHKDTAMAPLPTAGAKRTAAVVEVAHTNKAASKPAGEEEDYVEQHPETQEAAADLVPLPASAAGKKRRGAGLGGAGHAGGSATGSIASPLPVPDTPATQSADS